MLKNFRTYQLAVAFYKQTACLKLPPELRSQLARAASSVALNLAEGYGRNTKLDQKRFFSIALGSIRECQAILEISINIDEQITQSADSLAAHIYKLIKNYA